MRVSLPQSLLSLVALALAAPPGSLGPVLDLGLLSRRQPPSDDVIRRASPDSPTHGYAPGSVDCPSVRPSIRSAATVSTNESDWLTKRRQNTLTDLTSFLTASNITDFDVQSFISSHQSNMSNVPNIGIAVSGGGYRALLNGAGFIAAADNRTPGTTAAMGIGGLLQSATYLAGLSGGGWLVGSIYANNFTTVVKLRDGTPGSSIWAFSNSIFEGPKESGISIVNSALYWNDIMDAVDEKRNAGYDASLTDYWGRALSYQLINDTDGGPAYTWSSIADDENFKNAVQPMPIIVADGRKPGTQIISLNTTVYEFNPWEMGSFDPTVFGFVPQQYLGSNFSNGSIPTDQRCMSGFDQYGYVMGTSSSLFNQLIQQNLTSSGMPQALISVLQDILTDLGSNNDDIASYSPNPFLGYNAETNENAAETSLTLVDGGEDLQNIPLHPLIQPERDVDVIFAVDSSADTTYAWPNGTALRATWERSLEAISNGTQFPSVPDAETFINLGLNRRPTFFGCDEGNFTAGAPVPPLVVYVPNTPYTAWSNATTLTMSYSDSKRNNIIENGVNVATMGNGTLAGYANWRTCAGCAVLKRSLYKTNTSVPAVCQACFSQYCWNGTVDSTPVASFEPLPYLTLEAESAAAGVPRPRSVAALAAGVLGVAALVLAC